MTIVALRDRNGPSAGPCAFDLVKLNGENCVAAWRPLWRQPVVRLLAVFSGAFAYLLLAAPVLFKD
jgi:hypothetical protein